MKEKQHCGQSFVGVGHEEMASPKEFARPELGEEARRDLKVKVLTMVLQFIKSKLGTQETDQKCIIVEIEELNIAWQKANKEKKFKDYKCGTFKSFLKKQCGFVESTKDQFEISPAEIGEKLRDVNSKSKVLVTSNDNEDLSCMETRLTSKSSAAPPKNIDESKEASVVAQVGHYVQGLAFNGNSTPHLATKVEERNQCNDLLAKAAKRRTHKKAPEARVSQSE